MPDFHLNVKSLNHFNIIKHTIFSLCYGFFRFNQLWQNLGARIPKLSPFCLPSIFVKIQIDKDISSQFLHIKK